MNTKEEITLHIGGLIRDYLESGKRNATISNLSRRTGKSWSTIKRLAQNEMATITPDNAFAILSYFKSQNEALSVMKESYPKWYKYYSEHFSEPEKMLIESEIDWNRKTTWIVNRASRSVGVTEEEILYAFGHLDGYDALKSLKSVGALVEKEDTYFFEPQLNDCNSVSTLNRSIADAKNFNHNNIGDLTYYFRRAQEVSPECAKEIQNLTTDYYQKISQKIKVDMDTESNSEKVFITLNCFGDSSKEIQP